MKEPAGTIRMINVGEKPSTRRTAIAVGRIAIQRKTLDAIRQGRLKKGDVLTAARLAAIMGAKRTADLIPLCHQLPLEGVEVHIEPERHGRGEPRHLRVSVAVTTVAKTGVEMEALAGVSAALLTIYDMCKSIDQMMTLGNIGLIHKRGGRSGNIDRSPETIQRDRI